MAERTAAEAEAIDRCIAKLAVAFRVPADEVMLEAYADALEGLPLRIIESECREWIKSGSEHMPSAPQLRASVVAANARARMKPQQRALAPPKVSTEEWRAGWAKVKARLGAKLEKVGKPFPGEKG